MALVGNRLLIADHDNHRVVILDRKDGRQLGTTGSKGNGEGQLMHPMGVAAYGSTLVVSSDHKLSIFEDLQLTGLEALRQHLCAEVSWLRGQDRVLADVVSALVGATDTARRWG